MKTMTRALIAGLAVAAGVLISGSVPATRAGEADLNFGVMGGHFYVPVTSMREMRYKSIVRQQYDFSCGSAAVATLLTHHYGRPTAESETFEAMWAAGNQAKIQVEGFSLLDMKNYLRDLGYAADGFEMPLEAIAKIGVPAITMITVNGYKHFVVIKGMDKDNILVGDPAFGTQVVKLKEFEPKWDKVVLLVRNHANVGRENFNLAQDWRVRPKAFLKDVMNHNTMSNFSLFTGFNIGEF